MRLITFLGTGLYEEIDYVFDARPGIRSRYVAHAIARLWQATDVRIIATEAAEQQHGEGLRHSLENDADWQGHIQFHRIPDGRSNDELWEQFQVMVDLLRAEGTRDILVDITHGFRAQPFFAASALAFLRMSGELDGVDLKVLYGAFQRGQANAPIWDLTLFLALLDWANGAGLFIATGHAGRLIDVARRTEAAERARVIASGSKDFPRVSGLISALQHFSDDLATIRAASLVTGFEQDDGKKPRARSTAQSLVTRIAEYKPEVVRHLPPLAILLDKLEAVAQPLVSSQLAGESGQTALQALAELYLQFERYPEAAVVVREALVSRHAESANGVEVNSADYDDAMRLEADTRWRRIDRDASRKIADVRNDIEHAGFRRQPTSGKVLKTRVRQLVSELDKALPERVERQPKTLLVSRHPGAAEWIAETGMHVDVRVEHLDISQVNGGDTVVGTLPVNLIAAVCEAGARYYHLVIELPAEARGRELSAADLRGFGARLVAYRAAELEG